MSFCVAMLEAMKAEGLDLDACIRVLSAGEKRADPTNAQRQSRHRAKKAKSNGVTVTRDGVSKDKDIQTFPSTILPNEAVASLPIRQPISEATDCWAETAAAAGWPQIHSLSPNRQKLLASRLREHGIDGWRAAIAKARASPYLAGPDPPSWFTFSWLIKAENFLKLTEGNYDRRHNESADPTTTALNRILAGSAHH